MTTYMFAARFTPDPGGRFYTDGDFSGEEFRQEVLLDLFDDAVAANERLTINFDGCTGLPTSFSEEAFGGLVRKRPSVQADVFASLLEIVAPASPGLWPFVDFARQCVTRALANRK